MTSWAIVDYFLRPKPAYFTVACELWLSTVGMTRTTEKVYLYVVTFDLENKDWRGGVEKQKVVLEQNSATELFKGPLPGQPTRTKESEVPKPIVVSARLLDVESGEVLGRYSNW